MTAVEAKKTGGYLKDKVMIAKTRVMSDEVQRAILKTTSHKLKPPNEKHVDRLIAASYGHYPNVKLEDIVSDLEKRLHCHETTVVLKALVTLHLLLKSGSLDMGMAIARHSGLFHVSHIKELDTAASQFVKEYARYLEERCMAVLQSGCRNKFEKTKPICTELDRLSTGQALMATKCYTLQLDVLTEISLIKAPVWAENPVIVCACKLAVQDSKLLYVLLSKRSLWLVDNAVDFSEGDRMRALEIFGMFSASSKKLLKMFAKLRQQKTFLTKDIPDLTPLPDSTIEQLRNHLEASTRPTAAVTDIITQPLHALTLQDEPPHRGFDHPSPGMDTVVEACEAASAAGPPSPDMFTTGATTADTTSTSLFQEAQQQSRTPPPSQQPPLFQQQENLFEQQPVQPRQLFAEQQPGTGAQPQQQQQQHQHQQQQQQAANLDDIWNAAPVESINTASTQPAKPVTLDDLFT
eukprot:TRINITY_DN4495_c1_g1_i1.p1 TRINITY_DN4495_c1_g1~~TRINITY_DN4495_c1_g1_i1.p1  ORF type:complete len:475 (+),score=156.93 TRINITY_DN4495_c1_g1_i1:36-1427(+)